MDRTKFEKIFVSLKKLGLISNQNKITKKGAKIHKKILDEFQKMTLPYSYNEGWLRFIASEITDQEKQHKFEDLEGYREMSEGKKGYISDFCEEVYEFNVLELDFLNKYSSLIKQEINNDSVQKDPDGDSNLEIIKEINSLLEKECPRNTKHLDEVTSNIIKQNKKDDLYWKETQERQRELKEMYDSIPDEDNLN